ncbi:hypothetical protein FA13DRAFT_1800633 [Coprinellus micaceus]|uniref:Uncharacterized protein n=1 Tax=Coprinellus micaceus TaxID=71717 RepID=A0A4Y7SG77_COPMI|nr:hypothetical protein FA13DRAFT_1800633 [Coprinellus micaceus]
MSSGVQGIEVRKCQLDSFLCEIRKAELPADGRSQAQILHWSEEDRQLVIWEWPCYDDATSTKVPPDELEGHRQEYYFRAPSCLCAYLDDDLAYSECKITLIEPVPENKRDPRRRPFIGEANVHETIVVGGSTRIPCISKLVSNFFNGVEPNNDTSEVTRISSSSPRWRTPSLGTASGAVTALIKRIATKKSEIFSTYADNQPGIVISTEHGLERTCTKENHLLSEFELFSYPSALRGGCQVRRPTITNNISRPSEDEMGFNAEKYKAHHLSNSINDDKLAVKFGARARDKPESAIDEPISWLATPRRIPRASRVLNPTANILSDNALEKVQVVLFLRDASPSHVSRLLVAPRPPSSSVTPPSPTRNPTMGAIAVSQPIVQSVRKRKRGRARWWFPKPRWNDNPRHERCPSPATAREPLANLPHQRQLEMIMAHNNQDNPSVDFVKFTQSRIPQRPDQPQQHSNQPPFLNPDTNHAPSGNTFSPGMLNDFRRCSPSNPPNSMPGRPPSMAGISQLAQAPDRANQIRMSIRNNENMVNQPNANSAMRPDLATAITSARCRSLARSNR